MLKRSSHRRSKPRVGCVGQSTLAILRGIGEKASKGPGVFEGSSANKVAFSTAAITCDTFRFEAWRPVEHFITNTPNAHRSLRLSTFLAAACSGLMYAAVPRIIPASVAWIDSVGEFIADALDPAAGSTAFARPKSSTLTEPSAHNLILAGLRSR